MQCNRIITTPQGVIRNQSCKSLCDLGEHFCRLHTDITAAEHKSLWIRKYILASDGKPFFFLYDERKKERIGRDLTTGRIQLTQHDIDTIPANERYIDTFLLLHELGILGLQQPCPIGLYDTCLRYLSQFWFFGNTNRLVSLTVSAKKIVDLLVLRDGNSLSLYLQRLPSIGLGPHPHPHPHLPAMAVFLERLMDTDVGRACVWQPFREDLLHLYEKMQGMDTAVTVYIRDVFLPNCLALYKEQKQNQKARTNVFKEELMMVTWHPDRFMDFCLDEEEKGENRRMLG